MKKVNPLDPQSRWVVDGYRVEAALAAVDADPEAVAEVASITPLH